MMGASAGQNEGAPSAVACCAPLGGARLGDEEAEATAAIFRALADPNRVRIVNLLAMRGALCVCDLVEPLGLTQPTVSHHVKKLIEAGLLDRERRGTWVHYSLRPDAMRRLAEIVAVGEVRG